MSGGNASASSHSDWALCSFRGAKEARPDCQLVTTLPRAKQCISYLAEWSGCLLENSKSSGCLFENSEFEWFRSEAFGSTVNRNNVEVWQECRVVLLWSWSNSGKRWCGGRVHQVDKLQRALLLWIKLVAQGTTLKPPRRWVLQPTDRMQRSQMLGSWMNMQRLFVIRRSLMISNWRFNKLVLRSNGLKHSLLPRSMRKPQWWMTTSRVVPSQMELSLSNSTGLWAFNFQRHVRMLQQLAQMQIDTRRNQ